MMIMDDSND